MKAGELWWLPEIEDWDARLAALRRSNEPSWEEFVGLANAKIDFLRTERLDKVVQRCPGAAPPANLPAPPVRLAVLGSSTVEHLLPGIRVGLLRRRMWSRVYTAPYGQYLQDVLDEGSALHAFQPTAILFTFDARHALGRIDPAMGRAAAEASVDQTATQYRELWELARRRFACSIVQQTVLPVFPELIGSNERRLPGSPQRLVARLNERIAELADESGVDLLAADARAAFDGVAAWHDPVLWHRAKMEVAPAMGPVYGDLVARLIGAQKGRSAKCLVLDLDNTLWGGVVGDDGVAGLVLGQGSAEGEAFVAFQEYAQQLSRRGVILAVCSKNDDANARAPFDGHPEMALKHSDFAAFVAHWDDKATNLRRIAESINIGLDALVFADDNPFERNLIRRELPMVTVPELPADPAHYARCLADAGYFENVRVTAEDLARSEQYRANAEREILRASATDLPAYLKSLSMEMHAEPFDSVGLSRIVQLINKTNQFNLTTRRYSEQEVAALLDAPDVVTFQIRLADKFGDNGMICVIIAKPSSRPDELVVDTWLMSCRVLGRQVEQAALNLLVEQARERGYRFIVGEYRPTAKNGMVKDHYAKLGFTPVAESAAEGTRWRLAVDDYRPYETFIECMEAVA